MRKPPKPPGYWTYDRCKEEALKYDRATDFKDHASGAYKSAKKNEWYENISSHFIIHHPSSTSDWTYEKCKEEALKYKNYTEFLTHSPQAYRRSMKKKWYNEITSHFIRQYGRQNSKNPRWTYEVCEELTLEYDDLQKFRKENKLAAQAIWRNNWSSLFSHMKSSRKPCGYWSYERCKEEALKYKNRIEFEKKSVSAYSKIRTKRWYDLLSHMKKMTPVMGRYVYVFEFDDNHAYVGLTHDFAKRYHEHTSDYRSSVRKHHLSTGSKFKFILMTQVLPQMVAAKVEGDLMEEYTDNGWDLINRRPAGSLGSSG